MKLASVLLAAFLATVATATNSQPTPSVVSIEVKVNVARAEDIETFITVPIERILSGLPNLQDLRSRSSNTASYSEATFHGISSSESINRVEAALRDWIAPPFSQATRPVIKLQAKGRLATNQ